MNCQQAAEGGLAERYVLGDLSDPEQETFERHYFECARCFEDLEYQRALANALRAGRPAPAAGRPSVTRPVWAWAAAAAVAVVATSVLLSRAPIAPSPGSPSTAPPSPPRDVAGGRPASPAVSIADLARAHPPTYVPPTLRSGDVGRERFRRAMDAFARGDHAAAVPGLRAAAEAEPDAADIQFFLGTALLLAGETEAAMGPLRRTIALGETPFLEEAHFYLAKAHLKRGALDEARRELDRVVPLGGERAAEASALLKDLDRFESAP